MNSTDRFNSCNEATRDVWFHVMEEFLFFEKTCLQSIIKNDIPLESETDIQRLLEQVEVAKVQERNISERAFFTSYYYETEVERASDVPTKYYGSMHALVPSLSGGIGFGLYIDNGLIASLEGYTYGETWPKDLSRFELVHLIPTENGGNRLPKASWEE